jgi:hypothetical protein
MRLVPNQDGTSLNVHQTFHQHCPAGVTVLVKPHMAGKALIDSIGYKAANGVYRNFGVPAIPVRSGGSIPYVALFEKN